MITSRLITGGSWDYVEPGTYAGAHMTYSCGRALQVGIYANITVVKTVTYLWVAEPDINLIV